jgi:hypothetical protein
MLKWKLCYSTFYLVRLWPDIQTRYDAHEESKWHVGIMCNFWNWIYSVITNYQGVAHIHHEERAWHEQGSQTVQSTPMLTVSS